MWPAEGATDGVPNGKIRATIKKNSAAITPIPTVRFPVFDIKHPPFLRQESRDGPVRPGRTAAGIRVSLSDGLDCKGRVRVH